MFLISFAMQGEEFEESLHHQFFSERMLSRKTPADTDKKKLTTTVVDSGRSNSFDIG
jgi:hypothetical protein